jgi:putative addiction module component (TIGR02574 family)
MALWESLAEEREAELQLTAVEAAELDRRLEEHVQGPRRQSLGAKFVGSFSK